MLRAEQAWFSIVHELVAFCVDRHPAHSEPLIAGAMVYYYSPTARAVRWCRLLEPLPTKPNRWKVFSFADRSMVEVDGQAILYADRPRVAIRVHRTPLTSSPSSSTSTTILTPAMMPYGVNGEEMMPSTTSQAMARVVAMATSSEAFAREDWAQAMAAVVVGSAIADLSTAHLSSLVLHLLSTNTAVSYLAMGLSTAPDLAICAAQATRCFLNSWEIATRNATMALAAVDDAALRLFRRQVEDVAVAVYDSRERLERALGTNNTRGESAAGGLAAFYETRSWETFRDFTIQQVR